MTKRYADIAGDGGSNVAGQLSAQRGRLQERMSRVARKLLVMSGKGGVGKSTVTVNLAAGLASAGNRVGILDGDLYGPSLGRMLGLDAYRLCLGEQGALPGITAEGLKLMSMDFLLDRESSPLVWQGPPQESFAWKGTLEMHALREMLTDTDWGDLDFLILDLPPGTNQMAVLCELLPDLDGILAVGMPTAVARKVVRRSLAMATEVLNARVFGVVENMTGYYCSGCDSEQPLFAANQEARPYGDHEIIAAIPFDYRMAESCDRGRPFILDFPQSPTAQALSRLCRRIGAAVIAQPMAHTAKHPHR